MGTLYEGMSSVGCFCCCCCCCYCCCHVVPNDWHILLEPLAIYLHSPLLPHGYPLISITLNNPGSGRRTTATPHHRTGASTDSPFHLKEASPEPGRVASRPQPWGRLPAARQRRGGLVDSPTYHHSRGHVAPTQATLLAHSEARVEHYLTAKGFFFFGTEELSYLKSLLYRGQCTTGFSFMQFCCL